MRIISGSLRGKKLFTPLDERIRPTSDKAREALFNILFSKLKTGLEQCSVLDIFSGTGAIGLEAKSRGAKDVCFVDIDLSLTIKNAKHCGFDGIDFIKTDARKLPYAKKAFDIIFLDAPYNKGLSEPVLDVLIEKKYCHLETLIVVETAKDETLNLKKEFCLLDERTYGAAKFSFLKLV